MGGGDRSFISGMRGAFSVQPCTSVSWAAYRGESGQLTTSLLCSSGRKGKFLCRVPACTTT